MTTYNEESNIQRCLESIKPYLDYYCIGVDVKTTDNTKGKVLEVMGDVKGKTFDSPWNGFADARNQCLSQADHDACDFFIYLDADHTLTVTDKSWLTKLSMDIDSYTIPVVGGGMTHWLPWLIKANSPYKWHCVLHEYISWNGEGEQKSGGILNDISITHHYDGGGRAKGKDLYVKDKEVFLEAFQSEKDPFLIQRYTFYLAQSCKDAGHKEDAIRYYKMRTAMGGWIEEVYESWLAIARLTNDPDYYFKAIECVPERADAHFHVLLLGKSLGNWKLLRKALELYEQVESWNTVGLFMHPSHRWMVQDAAMMGYYELENMKRATEIAQKLLENPEVPDADKVRIGNNLPWFK